MGDEKLMDIKEILGNTKRTTKPNIEDIEYLDYIIDKNGYISKEDADRWWNFNRNKEGAKDIAAKLFNKDLFIKYKDHNLYLKDSYITIEKFKEYKKGLSDKDKYKELYENAKVWIQKNWDHQSDDPFYETDQIKQILDDIFNSYYNIYVIYGSQGIGKDTLYQIIMKNYKVEVESITNPKNIKNEKINIIKIPDEFTKKDFKNFIKELTKYYYFRDNKAKIIIIVHEDFVGLNLYKVRDIQIFNKAKIYRINSLTVKELLEIYKLIDSENKIFSENAVKLIANMSRGNCREFKKILGDYLKYAKYGEPVKEDMIKDRDKEFIKETELSNLYEDNKNNRNLETVTGYYNRVFEVIADASSKNIEFNNDSLLLKYANEFYPNLKLNSRIVSETLNPIRTRNNMQTKKDIKYPHILYVDENGFYKIPY